MTPGSTWEPSLPCASRAGSCGSGAGFHTRAVIQAFDCARLSNPCAGGGGRGQLRRLSGRSSAAHPARQASRAPSPVPPEAPSPPLTLLPPNPHTPLGEALLSLRTASLPQTGRAPRVCTPPQPCRLPAGRSRRLARRGRRDSARGLSDCPRQAVLLTPTGRRASEPPPSVCPGDAFGGAPLFSSRFPAVTALPTAAAATSPGPLLSPPGPGWAAAAQLGPPPSVPDTPPRGVRPSLTVLLRGVAAAGEPRRLQQAPARLAHALVRLRRHHVPGLLQV